ncbi:MAG TPA: DUF3662 and FHA domain-containing protein [Gaiellaceae bacterium]|nr:DUF3662 and FHA domain-containing protein [Gaiellaceae bacterium]
MSVLRSIESKIEGLFEGVFGRAFRTHVQPVELARKLAKEMDEHRSVSVSRVYVPNEYTVYLSPGDREQFSSYEGSLVGELQEYLSEHARREGYALLTPPRVLLETDDDLAIGEFGIATAVSQPAAGAPVIPTPPLAPPAPALPVAPSVEPSVTMVYKAREPAADEAEAEPPPVEREVVSLTVDGRVHPITSRTVVIGRSRECDVRLADSNVSRRHAELRQDGATYWLIDLGSTNGTELNGKRVEREKLADGDTITLGSSELVFSRSLP